MDTVTSAPKIEFRLAGALVVIPEQAITDLWMQRVRDSTEPARASCCLPGLGDTFAGGIYAGVSVENDRPVMLILLPGDEQLDWKAASKWAEEKDGALPSRIDQLVLFKNLKDQFRKEAYWSSEQYAGYDACAWYQNFTYGTQLGSHKDDELRARAVRRLAIQ